MATASRGHSRENNLIVLAAMDTLSSVKLLFTHIGSLKLENVFFLILVTSLHVLVSTPVSSVWLLQIHQQRFWMRFAPNIKGMQSICSFHVQFVYCLKILYLPCSYTNTPVLSSDTMLSCSAVHVMSAYIMHTPNTLPEDIPGTSSLWFPDNVDN